VAIYTGDQDDTILWEADGTEVENVTIGTAGGNDTIWILRTIAINNSLETNQLTVRTDAGNDHLLLEGVAGDEGNVKMGSGPTAGANILCYFGSSSFREGGGAGTLSLEGTGQAFNPVRLQVLPFGSRDATEVRQDITITGVGVRIELAQPNTPVLCRPIQRQPTAD
jgi:hypothetical protein